MLKFKITKWNNDKLVNPSIVSFFNKEAKITNNYIKTKTDLYFEVVIIDKNAMRRLNRNYRKVDKATDVLSFALHDAKQSIWTELLGEIYLCPDYINEICKKENKFFDYEITLTFVHGLLHLLGYDHANKKDEQAMFKLQKEITGDAF